MRVQTLQELGALQALTHPVRLQVLEALRRPTSASAIARELGQPRQKINYHLKELERGGLIRPAGERRKGNMVERLYESVAGTFLVSPRIAWGGARRADALRDQASLGALVALGERLQHNAAHLLDRAAFEGEHIASASVDAEVTFADAAAQSAFMQEYLTALGSLLKKHGGNRRAVGARFRVIMAVYPDPDEEVV